MVHIEVRSGKGSCRLLALIEELLMRPLVFEGLLIFCNDVPTTYYVCNYSGGGIHTLIHKFSFGFIVGNGYQYCSNVIQQWR